MNFSQIPKFHFLRQITLSTWGDCGDTLGEPSNETIRSSNDKGFPYAYGDVYETLTPLSSL